MYSRRSAGPHRSRSVRAGGGDARQHLLDDAEGDRVRLRHGLKVRQWHLAGRPPLVSNRDLPATENDGAAGSCRGLGGRAASCVYCARRSPYKPLNIVVKTFTSERSANANSSVLASRGRSTSGRSTRDESGWRKGAAMRDFVTAAPCRGAVWRRPSPFVLHEQ
jgi:hypothetical protein